jgi:hypothetical protein
MPWRPLSAFTDLHLVLLQHAGEREDVADVVVDDEHAPAGEPGFARRASSMMRRLSSAMFATCRCMNSAVSSNSC